MKFTLTGETAEEVWAVVAGYSGRYEVSNFGRVRSFNRKGPKGFLNSEPKILKANITKHGYADHTLFLPGGKRTRKSVARLVLEAFVGPCPDGLEAAHLDGDRLNNNADNLAWKTHLENIRDKYDHGTMFYGVRRDRRTWKETA